MKRDPETGLLVSYGPDPSDGLLDALDIFNWIENELWVVSKEGEKVPFKLNPVQTLLAQYVAHCWAQGNAVWLVIPKGRQMGISTFWQALFFAVSLHREGFLSVVMSHDENSVSKIFRHTHSFLDSLRPEVFRPLQSRQGNYVRWDHESSIQVCSAQSGDAALRGDKINAIHFSEVANYCDKGETKGKAGYKAGMQALVRNRRAMVVMESTAKGREAMFYANCELARKGGTQFVLFFLPWYLMDEYSVTWEDYRAEVLTNPKADDPGEEFVPTEDEILLRAKLRDMQVSLDEVTYRHPVNLTDEQLIWRRRQIADQCLGDVEVFKREFPSFYEEAFTSTETCMFSNETLTHYRDTSRTCSARGNVLFNDAGKPEFFTHHKGNLRVWSHPRPGSTYTIGADVASGAPNGDYSCAYVLEEGLKVVASWHGRIAWDQFADVLEPLGRYYNTAELVVERNFTPAVADGLHKKKYPNLYYYMDEHSLRFNLPGKAGFDTNRKTRTLLIDLLTRHTRTRALVSQDHELVREMRHFVWNETKQRFEAVSGQHDDRIIALGLALFRCPVEATVPPEEEAKEKSVYELFLEELAEERRRERRNKRGSAKGLRL